MILAISRSVPEFAPECDILEGERISPRYSLKRNQIPEASRCDGWPHVP